MLNFSRLDREVGSFIDLEWMGSLFLPHVFDLLDYSIFQSADILYKYTLWNACRIVSLIFTLGVKLGLPYGLCHR